MQAQQAPMIFTEAERQAGDRLLKLALETDRVEGYTAPHAVMIARLAETIGKEMGLHGVDLSALKFAALAHDIGERGMKRNYLLSPNALSWEERLDLWRHPILGEQATAELKLSRQTQLLIRWHHEWWNGQGYPDGLSGESIPLGARILRAVDTYCALISERPFRPAYELIEAEQAIADLAGIEFDPQVARFLLLFVAEEKRQREAEIEFQQQQAVVWNTPPSFELHTGEPHASDEPEKELLPDSAPVVESHLPEQSPTELPEESARIFTANAYEAAAYESVLSFAESEHDFAHDSASPQDGSVEVSVAEPILPDQLPTRELPAGQILKEESIPQPMQTQPSELEPEPNPETAKPAPQIQN
ncbi:MAG: HD domain-containing protein [Acidobacteria bacterium]|nr:HD domain-containing protein [Acidobacteriota bacterium]